MFQKGIPSLFLHIKTMDRAGNMALSKPCATCQGYSMLASFPLDGLRNVWWLLVKKGYPMVARGAYVRFLELGLTLSGH